MKEQKRLRDSIHNAGVKKDQQLQVDSVRWKRAADSALSQLNIAKQLLNKSQAKALELASRVEQAKKNKDTAGYVANCNELAVQVIDLNHQVDQYQDDVDSLIRAKDSVEQVAQRRLNEKNALYNELRASTLALDQQCSKVLQDYQKVARRAEKKYAIGIGGTAGITTEGKPGGSVGITVSRIVIRL